MQLLGKDLIIYILQHDLTDKPVVFPFLTEEEVAAKFNVGAATIRTWYALGRLKGVKIGKTLFFLEDVTDPRKDI